MQEDQQPKSEWQTISINVKPDEKEWLEEQAKSEDRSVSNWIRRNILVNYKEETSE